MNYFDFLEKYWDCNQFSPKVAGNIIAGTNGLYQEKETVFRNAAHWLLICKELKSSGQDISCFISDTLSFFLQNRPNNGSFPARDSVKNKSNGLIGSAWLVESLSEFIVTDDSNDNCLAKLCSNLLLSYPFEHEKGIWPRIIEPDGSKGALDRTFNHQLWMNMAHHDLLHVCYNAELEKRTESFNNNLFKTLKLNRFGIVYHTLGIYPHYHRTLAKRLLSPSYSKEMNNKEWGYHGFNLLAFSKIYKRTSSPKIRKILQRLIKPVRKKTFWECQVGNVYGSTYNPVGIEVAVALDVLGEPIKDVCNSLNFHFQECFSVEKFMFENSTDDATLNARLYEITFLSEETKNKLMYCDIKNMWSVKSDS